MAVTSYIIGATGASGGTDAGTASANGTYIQVTGANSTYNGGNQYTNGTCFLVDNGMGWGCYTGVNGTGTLLYTQNGNTSIITSAATMIISSGASPAPTVAIVTSSLSTIGYAATGAGTAAVNGTYLPLAGLYSTVNGSTQYSNGTYYITYNGTNYALGSFNNVANVNAYYIGGTGATTMQLTTWSVSLGASPGPILTVLDIPTYPYEQIINLQQYTLTSNGCIDPQYAIDNFEPTDAVFPAGGSVSTNTTRFLKVDWGYDAWITRIRINQTTTTSTSYAGINYESSYGLILNGQPAPQVPILAVTPIPEGNGVYSIYFTPPVLAQGIEYYPDFNNPSLSSLPEVDLYQLQVYEDTVWQTGVSTNMPIQGPTPTVQFATVGIELLTIYPWVAGASYPFPSASAVPLYAIQGLDFDAKSSLAIVRGGDSVHELGGYETHRETTGKFMVEQSDLRTFSIFLGDQVIIDAASGANGENQYATSLFSSQAPYFTVVGVSTHGDGTQDIVLPKVKITGLTRNVDTDKPTDLEVSFKPFFDKTYKLQSGGTGGLYEFVNNSGTSVLPPS